MLIDLHTHTRRLSWDSSLEPDDLIDLSKRAGLDGVCLSEHDYFWDSEAVRDLARRHNFLVLPAVEINTEDGHVLCFGLEKYVYGMHRWPELAGHVERARGVTVAAHPYRRQMPWNPERESEYDEALERARRNPVYPACAALESLNGRGKPAENAFASRLVEACAMAATGGSDAHQPSEVGRCATEFFSAIETLEELIAELRAGRFRPVSLSDE